MDRIERQCRLGAKVTGTWHLDTLWIAGLNRIDDVAGDEQSVDHRFASCWVWCSQPYSKQHSFFCPQGPHFDKISTHLRLWHGSCVEIYQKTSFQTTLVATLEAARVHRAEATATGWFRRWEDDVEFCRSRWVLSKSQGLGVLSMGAPAALAYETWAPGQSNLVRWINLIVGLQEKDIHNHPQMFHHDISNAVHLSTFLKTGA